MAFEKSHACPVSGWPSIEMLMQEAPAVPLHVEKAAFTNPAVSQVVSHNVRRFRFALPEKNMILGLPIGSHISISAQDTAGKAVMRPYTPVTDDNLKGAVEFVIKVQPFFLHPSPDKANHAKVCGIIYVFRCCRA